MTTRMNRTLCALMAATALVAGVAGCATPVVLGGAALGGMMAIDRRTAGTQIEDETIAEDIRGRLQGWLARHEH